MRDTVRVTLVFPRELWEEVKRLIPPGERSRVIAEATRLELKRRKRMESVRRLKALQEMLCRKYGRMPSCVEEIRRMREERDG